MADTRDNGYWRRLLRWLLDEPPQEQIALIPLRDAIFCESCEVITKAQNDHCTACGGSGAALIHLAQVLDRETEGR